MFVLKRFASIVNYYFPHKNTRMKTFFLNKLIKRVGNTNLILMNNKTYFEIFVCFIINKPIFCSDY